MLKKFFMFFVDIARSMPADQAAAVFILTAAALPVLLLVGIAAVGLTFVGFPLLRDLEIVKDNP